MTRFYSQSEIKKFEQKLKTKETTDINNLKESLKEDINKEYHRINVDSAKKKAVNQRMDYDGFHQMVLGADLKGLKSDEILYVNFKRNEKVLNNTSVKEKLLKEIDVLDGVLVENLSIDDKQLQFKFENDKKELSIKYKTKLTCLSEEEYEKGVEVLFDIQEKVGFKTFFENNSPIEPNLFTTMIKNIIIVISLSYEIVNEEKEKRIELINNLSLTMGEIENLKKLKMFLSGKLKKELMSLIEELYLEQKLLNLDQLKKLIN